MEELFLCHHHHHSKLTTIPKPTLRRHRRRFTVAASAAPAILRAPVLPKKPADPPNLPKLPLLPSPTVTADADAATFLLSAGVTAADLRRAAGMCPELLSAPSTAISSVLDFLVSEAGVSAGDIPCVLRRRPRLLVSPVAARLRPTLYFLRALGLPDIARHADLLAFSVEDKMLPRIELLESLGMSRREARSVARRFPAIFYYGIDGNLRPKAEFLMTGMGRRVDELFDFPEYFSYALQGRIVPRHEACAARGVRLALGAMLRPPDAWFRDRLEQCVGSVPPRKRSPLWRAPRWPHGDEAELPLLD